MIPPGSRTKPLDCAAKISRSSCSGVFPQLISPTEETKIAANGHGIANSRGAITVC
jgi:hypothetical protein